MPFWRSLRWSQLLLWKLWQAGGGPIPQNPRSGLGLEARAYIQSNGPHSFMALYDLLSIPSMTNLNQIKVA